MDDLKSHVHKIVDNIDAPDPELLAKSKVLVIRHATTHFNLEFMRVAAEGGFDKTDQLQNLKARSDLVDPSLADIGLK